MICSQDVDPQLGTTLSLVARLPRLRRPLPPLSLRLRVPSDEPRRRRVRLRAAAAIHVRKDRRRRQRRHRSISPRRLHQEARSRRMEDLLRWIPGTAFLPMCNQTTQVADTDTTGNEGCQIIFVSST